MHAEDDEAREHPGGRIAELQQGCARGAERDERVEHHVCDLHGAGNAPERRKGGDESGGRDEENRPDGLREKGHGNVKQGAEICADGGDEERRAKDQEDSWKRNLSRPPRIIVFDRLRYGVQLRRIHSHPAIEARGKRDEPEEEQDPDRIVDRVDDERTFHVDHRNVQRGLNLHDIVVAADPGAGKRTERHPRVDAEMLPHDEEGDDEPGCDRDGRSEEAEEHARADAKDLADIRAQEHREDHRIGQERRKLAIDGLRRRHAPDAERSEQHRTDVDEDDAGDEAKDRPPRHPFGSKNHGREEHKDGDIGKSVGDHQIPPFLQKLCSYYIKNNDTVVIFCRR